MSCGSYDFVLTQYGHFVPLSADSAIFKAPAYFKKLYHNIGIIVNMTFRTNRNKTCPKCRDKITILTLCV